MEKEKRRIEENQKELKRIMEIERKQMEFKKIMKLDKNHISILLFCVLMAVSSNIMIPTEPIPFTLQTFVLNLLSLFLNPISAFISTMLFLFLGLIGLPVFADFESGIEPFLSPSAGFLVGFPVVAVWVSFLKDKMPKFLALLIGLVILFTIGTLNLVVIHKIDLVESIKVAVIPFILPGIIKIVLSLLVYTAIKKYIIKD